MEDGATGCLRLGPNPASMRFDDRTADRQPQSHTAFLGTRKRLEKLRQLRGVDAPAGVGDRYPDQAVRCACGRYGDVAHVAAGDCLDAIADQVDQHLLDLDAVDEGVLSLRVEVEERPDAAFARPRQCQPARILDDRGKILDMFVDFAAGDEIAQAPNDLTRTERFLRRFADRFPDEGAARFVAPVKQFARGLHVIGDRGQRLVQFVRQGRRHRAHRAHARNVDQLGLQFLEPQLRPLLIGEVADESGEDARAVGIHLTDRQFHRERASVTAFAHDDAADSDDAAVAGGQVARDIIVVPVVIGIGHQHADITADQLGFAIAEQPLRGGAERHDDAAFVDHDHRAGHRRQDRTNVQFALRESLLDRLPRRHVMRAMAEAPDRSVIVAHRKDRHIGQKLRAVLADAPCFGAQWRGVRGLIAIGRRAAHGDVPLGVEQIGGPPANLFRPPAGEQFGATIPAGYPAIGRGEEQRAVGRPVDEGGKLHLERNAGQIGVDDVTVVRAALIDEAAEAAHPENYLAAFVACDQRAISAAVIATRLQQEVFRCGN